MFIFVRLNGLSLKLIPMAIWKLIWRRLWLPLAWMKILKLLQTGFPSLIPIKMGSLKPVNLILIWMTNWYIKWWLKCKKTFKRNITKCHLTRNKKYFMTIDPILPIFKVYQFVKMQILQSILCAFIFWHFDIFAIDAI